MTIWNKLVTALRGAAHEAGEAVTDSQALRILDQEIRDADSDLNKSKEALADIMAKQKLAAGKLKQTQERIAEYERSEEHTSELQSPCNLVCRLLLEKKKKPPTAISDD